MRKQRYIALIDSSLGYLLGQQDMGSVPPGLLGGNANAGVFMSCAALWAYDEPASRYHGDPLMIERARLALDCRESARDSMHGDFFSPAPVLEAAQRLRVIEPGTGDRWVSAALEALEEQARGSLHDRVGHWSDWDTFYAYSAALAWRLTGKDIWRERASHHIQFLRANAVGVDGFLHWTTPYETWNPSANYGGLIMANLARYVELTGDADAETLIDETAEYFFHYIEPSGLMDFTASIFPKHYHENKKDSYCFAAAAVEFLAARTGDPRYSRVAEIMQKNLQGMLRMDGGMDMKPWPAADFPHSVGLQALATLYLKHAAAWCKDGASSELPDGYIRRHERIHGFKGRHGDFAYSVGCNESQASLAGAAQGLGCLLEGVFCMIKNRSGELYGQVGPFWREYGAGDSRAMASTSFYHPVLLTVGAGLQPMSPWLIRQTYIGVGELLIGFISFEAAPGLEEDSVIADIHLGPAGRELSWGSGRVEGSAMVETENSRAKELGSLKQGAWVHYGELGLHFLDYFGEGARLAIWDGVKGQMLHAAPGMSMDFNTVISNDVVAEFSAVKRAGTEAGGIGHGLLFAVFPSSSPGKTREKARSGDVELLSAPSPGRRTMLIRSDNAWHVALITHERELKTMPLEMDLPSGERREVTVHAGLDSPPIRSFIHEGRRLELEIPAVSPVLLVRIVRRLGR